MARKKDWDKEAEREFTSMSSDEQESFADLYKLTRQRS